MATTAERAGDGWRLDGVKSHVLDGATADELAVVVRLAGSTGDEGLGVLLVPGSAVEAAPVHAIDATLPMATVTLRGVEVDAGRVLVEPGDPRAGAVIDRAVQEATTAIALSTVAASRAIFEMTLQYAKDREQFGRPIGSFQAVKHRLADAYLAVERASALAYFAALTIAEDDDRRAVASRDGQGRRRRVPAAGGQGRAPAARRRRLHVGARPALPAQAGQGRRPAVRHGRRPPRPPGPAPRAGGGGVKLRYDDAVEAFRAELVEWLTANRPSAEEMAADPSVSTGHAPGWARRWTRTMFDAGWLVPGWPPERGGRNAGPVETLVYMEELAKAHVPRTTNVQGLGIVAPSILDYGTARADPRLRHADPPR